MSACNYCWDGAFEHLDKWYTPLLTISIVSLFFLFSLIAIFKFQASPGYTGSGSMKRYKSYLRFKFPSMKRYFSSWGLFFSWEAVKPNGKQNLTSALFWHEAQPQMLKKYGEER